MSQYLFFQVIISSQLYIFFSVLFFFSPFQLEQSFRSHNKWEQGIITIVLRVLGRWFTVGVHFCFVNFSFVSLPIFDHFSILHLTDAKTYFRHTSGWKMSRAKYMKYINKKLPQQWNFLDSF